MYVVQRFLFLNLFCLDLFIILFFININLFLYTVVNTGSSIKKNLYRKKINYNPHFETQSPGYLASWQGWNGMGSRQLSSSQNYRNVGRIMELCFAYFFLMTFCQSQGTLLLLVCHLTIRLNNFVSTELYRILANYCTKFHRPTGSGFVPFKLQQITPNCPLTVIPSSVFQLRT